MLQTSVAAAEHVGPPRARSAIVRRVVLYVLLVAFALLFFTPFVWTIATSFKTLPDSAYFNLIPHPFTTEAWKSVWTDYDFKRYALNSLFLAVTSPLLNLFLASLGGYAFARLRFPGREVLFLLILGTLMIPDQLRLIPVFVMLTNWHLIGNFSGYILINLVTAVNLFFMRQYFLTIPEGLRGGGEARRRGLLQDLLAHHAPARRPGDRGARDPPVPGDLERLLLAADPLRAGQRAHVHDAARPRPAHASPTSRCGLS